MIDKESSNWKATIGNDADFHNPTAATSTTNKPKLAAPDLLSKVVLLVDSNSHSRESRAKVLRTLGVTVHSAASAATARTRLESSKFDLVLVDLGRDIEGAESLVAEIRLKNRKQRVAFLVGKPLYVASSLNREKVAVAAASANSPLRQAPAEDAKKIQGLSDFGQRIKQAEAETAI